MNDLTECVLHILICTTRLTKYRLRDTWNQRLIALGDDEKAIEYSMQAARAVVRCHAERMNAFNRAVSLPAEILEPIFLAVQAADPFTGTLHHSWKAESEWILVSHVCRRWREVGYVPILSVHSL